MQGKGSIRFVELVRDTIRVHGLQFAVSYYGRRLPRWELRFWMRAALEG